MEHFNWRISSEDFSEKTTFGVHEVQFGDGYQQVQPKGLRPRKREWELSISAHKAVINNITAFFDRHQGVKGFRWRDTVVRVTEYTVKPLGGTVYKIIFSFKEMP